MKLSEVTKEAFVISENASFGEALDMMLNNYTNTLLAVDDKGKLSGEVSVSDLFDAVIPMTMNPDDVIGSIKNEPAFIESVKEARETPIFDFMSTDYNTVTPNDTIMDVAAVAIAHQQARIPVVDHDGHPVGIISRQGLKQIIGKFMQS